MHFESLSAAITTRTFIVAFTALFAIVNPIGSAFIFYDLTSSISSSSRATLARSVALNSLLLLAGSLLIGKAILILFGISIGALRLAGGLVVCATAWRILMSPSVIVRDAAVGDSAEEIARRGSFFPLTMPITTGPGSVAVAISLSSSAPVSQIDDVSFFAGLLMAASATAAVVLLFYSSTDWILAHVGSPSARVITSLNAFLLLCIGVQVMSDGAGRLWQSWTPVDRLTVTAPVPGASEGIRGCGASTTH